MKGELISVQVPLSISDPLGHKKMKINLHDYYFH